MTMKTISFSAWKQRVKDRRAQAADRRAHDGAVSDRRVAIEHYASRQRAVQRGEPDCTYCV